MKKKKEKLEKLLADFTERLTAGASQGTEKPSNDFNGFNDSISLLKTVRTISAVFSHSATREPPEEFIARVSHATQERLVETRHAVCLLTLQSTEKIQRIIGMAVTVEDFRKSLFRRDTACRVSTACRNVGFDLTPKELAALRNLKEDAVKEFANSLDERITKFFPANLP